MTEYVLIDDGEMFVYLGNAHGFGFGYGGPTGAKVIAEQTPAAGGPVMQPSPSRGWWVCAWGLDEAPARVVVELGPEKERDHYELSERYAHVAEPDGPFPRTLTVEEYSQRTDEDGGAYDPATSQMYESVMREVEREPVVLDSFLVLEGQPAPQDGGTWVAALPYELRERPEYRHLFPGHLAEDFRAVLAKRLEALPYVQHCFSHQPGPLDVSVRVFYEPTVWEPKRNSRGRVTKQKGSAGYVTHRLDIAAPRRIEGANRAEAVKRWDEEMGSFLAAVEEAAHVVPCGHCKGRGWKAPEK